MKLESNNDRGAILRALKLSEALTQALRTLATPPQQRPRDPIVQYRITMLGKLIEQRPELHDKIVLKSGEFNISGLYKWLFPTYNRTVIRGYLDGGKPKTSKIAQAFEALYKRYGVQSDIERTRMMHALTHETFHETSKRRTKIKL